MKNPLRIFSIVLLASLLSLMADLSVAEPSADCQGGYGMGYGPGYGMGPGAMGGYGHGMGPGMMGWDESRGLGLSDEQRSKIRKIHHELRGKQWALMGQMMDARDKLRDLYDAETQDAAAINKQYQAIDDLRKQMVDNSVDAHNRVNAILTKEQREKARDWGRGYGPMMHGY